MAELADGHRRKSCHNLERAGAYDQPRGDSGVAEGMIFRVVERPIQIVDPDTKTPLGVLTREKIRVKISEVYPKFSVARTYETYQAHESAFTSLLSGSFSPRTITKVRTLKTLGGPIANVDENVAAVNAGDAVAQIEVGSNSATVEN